MAAILKHWRESASLILVTSSNIAKGVSLQLTHGREFGPSPTASPFAERLNNDDNDANIDVLMLKRSSKSSFMPNLHVFPGGVAVDGDFSSQWNTVFDKLGSNFRRRLFNGLDASTVKSTPAPMFTRDRGEAFSAIRPEVAFRICAIRETFEESGVLLARPAKELAQQINSDRSNLWPNGSLVSAVLHEGHKDVIDEWRRRVNQDPNEFLLMCLQLDLVPEIWSLYEWSCWLTPTVARGKRFDAIFYICCLEYKPRATQDAAEMVQATWASPFDLLTAFYHEEGGLATPQVYELSKLLNFNSASDVLRFVTQPNRARAERYLSVIVKCAEDHLISIMPGDELYPTNPELFEPSIVDIKESVEELDTKYSRKHRILHDSKELAYPDCNVPPQPGHVRPKCDLARKYWLRLKAKL